MRVIREGLDEDAVRELAAEVARRLLPGDVVVLAGEVGSGKSTFVRAAARALGVKERVTSPTYQLARAYEGSIGGRRVFVNHLDLYRVEEIGEWDALSLEDYLAPDAVTFIEWADPALGLLENPTLIRLEHESPRTRRVSIEGPIAERMEC